MNEACGAKRPVRTLLQNAGGRELRRCWLVFAVAPALATTLLGASQVSVHDVITYAAVTAEGGPSANAPYALQSSVGGIGAAASTVSAGIKLSTAGGFVGQLNSVVAGRRIFYNDSSWDGNDAGATAGDDLAIAPDKAALRPGQKASFVNYTSYSKGINGVMLDVSELSAIPQADDFTFKVGNSDTPSLWNSAPNPTTVRVRWGAGTGGSDRVTLIWPNNVIQNQWLAIAVKPTSNTGLGVADVFYFGNASGDSGDSADNAQVNVYDEAQARAHPSDFLHPAELANPYDFNRDQRVNVLDEAVARANPTSFLNALELITPSGASLSLSAKSLTSGPTVSISATKPVLSVQRRLDGAIEIRVGDPWGRRSLILQAARDPVRGPWRVVQGLVGSRWILPAAGSEEFFRLVAPGNEGATATPANR